MSGTEGPPAAAVRGARDRARDLGRSVFLFHDGREWVIEAEIGAVPMDREVREVPPGAAGRETDNRGGC